MSAAAAAHDLGGSDHNADSLSDLNSKITDATLIDTGDSRLSDARTPTSHATSHQSGGGDAIKLDDLAASYKRMPSVLDMVDRMMGEGKYAEDDGEAASG